MKKRNSTGKDVMVVHSYLRFSSAMQEDGDSIRRQDDAADQFCKKRDWHLSDIKFIDRAKSSYKGDKQTALREFMKAAEDDHDTRVQPGETLLIEAIDRLSRKGISATQTLINRIFAKGINIAIITPYEKVYYAADSKDNIGSAIELASFAFQAHLYSKSISTRVKSSIENTRKEFENGNRKRMTYRYPCWLEVNDRDEFVVKPGAKAAIKYIFKRTLDGAGRYTILKELNEKFKPIGNQKRSHHWQSTLLRNIVRSRQVLGELESKSTGKVHEGYYPAIIDEKTWLAANAMMSARKSRKGTQTKRVNIFNGMIYHAVDDCTIVSYPCTRDIAGGKKEMYIRFKSYNSFHRLEGSSRETFKGREFEDMFFHLVPCLDLRRKQRDPRADLIKQRDYLKGEIEAIEEQMLSGGSARRLGPMVSQLDLKLEGVESELQVTPEVQVSPTRDYRKKLAAMRRGTLKERELVRDRLRAIVKSIYILPFKSTPGRTSRVKVLVEVEFHTGEIIRAIESKDELIAMESTGERLVDQCAAGFRVNPETYTEFLDSESSAISTQKNQKRKKRSQHDANKVKQC